MREWSRFELGGYRFVAFLPDSGADTMSWTIVITDISGAKRPGREEHVTLTHAPRFGPDVDDVAQLEERVEQLILELGIGEK